MQERTSTVSFYFMSIYQCKTLQWGYVNITSDHSGLVLILSGTEQVKYRTCSYLIRNRTGQLIREVMWKCDGEENVSRSKKEEEETGEDGDSFSDTMVHTLLPVHL